MKTTLLNNLDQSEQKLLHLKKTKKEEDIQLFGVNKTEALVTFDATVIENATLLIGYRSNANKVCMGRYGDKVYSFPAQVNDNADFIRVWIDSRKNENVKFHVNFNGAYSKFVDGNDSDALLITFIENPDFVQLSLYDGSLFINQVSHIFTSVPAIKNRIRTIAYSMLNNEFPGLCGKFIAMEGEQSDGEE